MHCRHGWFARMTYAEDIFKMSAMHIFEMSKYILNAPLDMSGVRSKKYRHLEAYVWDVVGAETIQ